MEERWIDANKLVDTLIEDYDIEDTPLLRAVIREIDSAPVVARTRKEWWQLRMDVQEKRIDRRFKDRPIAKERYIKFLEIVSAAFWLFLILGAMGLMQTIFFWMH